jgi:hypothetical protein
MISGPAGIFGLSALESELLEIELIDKHIDRSDWIVLVDVVVKSFRE